MKRRCEICSTPVPRRRLCACCAEAIARLQRAWANLSMIERGMMHYQVAQQRRQEALGRQHRGEQAKSPDEKTAAGGS